MVTVTLAHLSLSPECQMYSFGTWTVPSVIMLQAPTHDLEISVTDLEHLTSNYLYDCTIDK